jgi:hypothetical protein
MSMDRRPFFVAGCCLALVLLSLCSGNAFAQASCSGIAAFQSCTAYASGAKVVYNNSLYHTIAPIPSNRDCPPNSPYNPGNDNWWVNDGTCSGGAATATATKTATATATRAPGATATATPRSRPTATPTTPSSTGGGSKHAPYADISLASGENIVANVSAAGLKGVTLAFLVDGGCTANWGGLGGNVSNATFPNGTSVASAISSLSANGVSVIISWGGALGSIQSACGTASQVQAMYQSVFNAYPSIAGQDFDIEGGINNTVVAQALAGLKAANPSKSISLTLPVLSSGLVSAGLNIVNACHSAGFHPDSINVMAMDMGSANDNGGNMLLSSEQAATNTHNQTGDKVGITPMIGVNDTSSEIFTLQNATDLVSWAKGQSYVNRLAFWSLGRDNGGCAGQGSASATCSSISQSTWQFSSIFKGF